MFKPSMIAAVVALGLAAPSLATARTTTISHVYEYGLGPSNVPYVGLPQTVSYVVPAFDSSLGTLLGVGYEVVAHAELGVTWVGSRAGMEVFGAVGQIGGEFRTWLNGYYDPTVGGASIVLPDAATQFFYFYPAPKSGRYELRSRWSSSGYLDLTNGGAENFQGDAVVVAEYAEYLGAYFDLGNMEVFDVTASAEHRLGVTYYFDDGSIPEPGAWALMISGIFAAGATLRRQREEHRRMGVGGSGRPPMGRRA